MGKAKKGKKNMTADDGDSDVETTNIDSKPSQTKGKKIANDSEDSEDEKLKSKSKHKKSVDDVKEVTKNIKNVSISNKSKKKVEISSDEEESDEEPVQTKKKGKKQEDKKSVFSLLAVEDEDSAPEAPPSSDEDIKPAPKQQKKPAQEKKEPAGKKSKKAKRKKDDSDDELDKVLAELQMEYEGVKKEDTPAPVPEKLAESEDTTKSKKKGKKEQPKVEEKKEEEEKDGSDNENDITIKTAAQKKKEKKEREKLKKQEAKKKEKAHEGSKEKSESVEKPEPVPEKPQEAEKELSEEKELEAAGDTPAEGKKKKKGKGEKDDDKGKKGPTKKTLAAMQEALKKVKEEEERLQKIEEERIRQEEERERQRLEAIRLEKEKKDRKKLKEKERKERLKAEGKLLTPKQKAEKARAQAMLESLKAQGIEIGSAEKKPLRPGTRIKPTKLKTQLSQEAPSTPAEEKKIELEIVDKKAEVKSQDKESDNDSVKEAWDAESSEEEEPVQEPAEEKCKSTEQEAKEEDEEDSSDEDDDDSSEEESSSEDSDDDQMTDAQKKRELVLKRLEKRRQENEANKVNNPLRAAVVCVLGHVDTGKTKILDKLRRTNVQDGEAGGITQQIGATNVPIENIKEQTRHVKGVNEIAFELPGLLIIDTPGHESFSNLRSRGSSLCDIAILVVDIMHGLEPQTIESINLLKQKKTPFLVALNKIDRLYDWQSMARKDVRDILKLQQQNTQMEFEKRSKDVILQFAEQGLNAALFYENPDPRSYVSLVPTSAVTGEGMGNLLAMIVQACEGPLHKRLVFSNELLATVLEVKAIPGLGTTIDTILINGTLREGDTMVVAGTDGPIVTQIRSLLMPQPMKELRVKNAYIEHKEVVAAQGVKIAAKELEKAIAGLNLLIAQKPDEIEVLKEEVARELKSALSGIKLSERGVYVQASTLGSLEALLDFLRTSKIPYSAIRIGPVVKRDVMKASAMLEHDSQYATILAFDVKIERDAQEMADQLGVKIFAADIIYHLFDKFTAYREELKQRKREEFKNIAVFPCKLKVLPQFVFNSRDPIVMGVMVEAGIVKEGTPICVPSKEFVELGIVTSIEMNHKTVESARKGMEVCIKIEPIPGESPKMFGRHFDETDFLVSKDGNILEETIHTCTPNFAKNDIDEHLYRCKQDLTTHNYQAVPQTYNDMVASYENKGLQLIAQIPSFKSVKSSMYRYRNKVAAVDKIQCDKIEEVQIPTGYEDFLMADYYYDNKRIIIFCSQRAKELLLTVEDYYSDGTFKICPKPFDQLYTIHGDIGSTVSNTNIVPLVYSLMSDRQQSSYVALFSLIKSQVPGWNPIKYKTDYETAAMSAIAKVFPSVIVSGCYYHFNKAIWRKGRELEITKSNNPTKIREVALSAVLPLLPPSEVIKGWSYITRKQTEEEDMIKFRAYMTKQWLKEEFIQIWNVYGSQHRTTNCLEGWHNKLNREVGRKKPNIIHFLNIIQKDASFFTVRHTMIKNKLKIFKERQKKYVLKDEFIKEMQMEFLQGDMSVGHFLEALRH